MNDIKFQWDDNKNKINQKKHKISFEEAQSVFFDEEGFNHWRPRTFIRGGAFHNFRS